MSDQAATRATPDPDVSVVVITRDRWPLLQRTLRALEALPTRPHVLVVDNGSGDGTSAEVRRCHPGVELIRLVANAGPAGRNLGVRAATTPFVAFADDDSWWEPEALPRAVSLLAANPRLGLLAGSVLVGPGRTLDPTCEDMADSPLPREPDLPGTPVLGFLACAAVVRREAYLAVGGFGCEYGVGGEEGPLAIELAATGWGVSYVPEVTAVHHPAPARNRAARRRVEERNRLLLAWQRRRLLAAARITAGAVRRGTGDPAARRALADAGRQILPVIRNRRPLPLDVERRVVAVDERRHRRRIGIGNDTIASWTRRRCSGGPGSGRD